MSGNCLSFYFPITFYVWCPLYIPKCYLLANNHPFIMLPFGNKLILCPFKTKLWVYDHFTFCHICLKFHNKCHLINYYPLWLHNLRSPFKIPFYLVPPIVFSSRAKAFFYSGTIRRGFAWNGTTVSHWRFHDNRRMNTSADVSKFKITPFSC
jgi:hypothetical protein